MLKTKQHRFNKLTEIPGKLAELKGKNVQLVLENNHVLIGVLRNYVDRKIELVNQRGGQHNIEISSIREVYFDTLELC